MDYPENQSNVVHFEIMIRCDACNQSYHGKARVEVSSLGYRVSKKTRKRLNQMVEGVLSGFWGVGVQRCPYCGHIQEWNIIEVAEYYAQWWSLGISFIVFLFYYLYRFNAGELDPRGENFWPALITVIMVPIFTYYVGALITRIVARIYYRVKYSTLVNNKPEIRRVSD